MTWFYEQISGRLFAEGGVLTGIGESGFKEGRNNPDLEDTHIGPIPIGVYTIHAPLHHPGAGRYALPLIPNLENKMFGRNNEEFFIQEKFTFILPGSIVLGLEVRRKVWAS